MTNLKSKIREVQDWPKKGINFKDITTLLQDKDTFRETIDALTALYDCENIDKIVGIDARGFLLAAPVAYNTNSGLAIVRKPNKLPYSTIEQEYELEYGTDKIQMHEDTISEGESVLLVDDLIATGGTAEAACILIEKLGGKIAGIGCIVDLPFLGGSGKLKDKGYEVKSLVEYESE